MTKNKWPMVKLGEICIETKARTGVEDVPVYSVTKHSGFVANYFKKSVHSKDLSKYKLVEEGDFAYATIHLDEGSIGIAPEQAAISPMYTTFRLTKTDRVDPFFLFLFLKSDWALAQYKLLGTGSVERRKSIKFKSLQNLKVPLPPLGEQKRIAGILSFSASLIEKSRQAVALLNPNLSFSESLVVTAESTVPLSTYVTGITSGKSLVADNEGESQNKVLKISAVTSGTFLPNEVKTLPKDYDPDESHRVAAGDILVSRANTTELVGASVLVDEVGPHIFLPDKLWKLTLAKDVNPVFLWALLQSKTIRSRISRRSTGSSGSMKNISKKNFLSVQVPDISIGLQNKIGNSIQIIREQKAMELRRLSYLQNLHASLVGATFEGDL